MQIKTYKNVVKCSRVLFFICNHVCKKNKKYIFLKILHKSCKKFSRIALMLKIDRGYM